jgi:hypothetical protein
VMRRKREKGGKAHLVSEEMPTPLHPSTDERHTVSALVVLFSSDEPKPSCTRCRRNVAFLQVGKRKCAAKRAGG